MKWYDKTGKEHEQALTNADAATDIKEINALDSLARRGIISQEQRIAGLNIIRPAEGDELALGDMGRENTNRHCKQEQRKRGRKSFKELGE